METINFESTPLPEVTVDSRTISGLALPYGVPGRTSGGALTVDAGAIQIPKELRRVKLLRDHNRNAPVGYLEVAEDGPDGLTLKFKVGNTDEGTIALTEAAEGIRDGLSVELSAVKRSADGTRIVSAVLDAVAIVAVPAFSDARVSKVVAEDTDTEAPDAAVAPDSEKETEMEENTNIEAAAEEAKPLQAPSVIIPKQKSELTFSRMVDVLYEARNGDGEEITAALADITRSANSFVTPAGFVGELWSGIAYQRQIVPQLTSKALTSYKIDGWRWTTKPAVGTYAGDKAAIPSNAPVTEAVTVTAQRLAGGHDIDRKFIDFNDRDFLESYFRAMAEDYAKKSDGIAASFVTSNATPLEAPAGSDLLHQVALGSNKVFDGTGANATYVLVNPADLITLLDISSSQVSAFLGVLGLSPESFVRTSLVSAGTVIVGTKAAATFYELPGSPIRVEAEHIANGGRDAAVFGYVATLLNDARGIVKVTNDTP